MPTGYTAQALDKRMGLKDFAMTCARAFGACVTMRDDDNGVEIPDEFKPSSYHIEAKATAEKELARLRAMTNAERIAHGEAERAKDIKLHEEWLAKDKAENDYLTALRADVEAWMPPTAEHKGLHEFMLQQIEVSMNDLDYIEDALDKARASSPGSYYAKAVKSAEWSLDYNTKGDALERERCAGRTEWVRKLRESLK